MAAFTIFTAELPKALSEAISGAPYKIYMYLEYATSGDVPGYQDSSDIGGSFTDPKAYYNDLAPTANYLRVPALRDPNVINSVLNPASTTTNFFGQSTGSVSQVNSSGAAFATGVNCYGAALVLAKDDLDRTKDLVMARSYFTDEPLVKTSASELFVTFPFVITVSA